MKRSWIKLYIEMLEDPQTGRLGDHLWRRLVELFLLAGRNGNDGLLPPVPDMVWRLRVSAEELTCSLQALAEAGVVQETPQGWLVNHFAETQSAMPVDERMRQYRDRKKEVTNRNENGYEAAAAASSSTSPSDPVSGSVSEEEGVPPEKDRGKRGEVSAPVPGSPAEAMLHPDVRVFAAATGGRIPGLSEYRTVIETVRFLRAREKLDDPALVKFLAPYWLAWSGRKRLDGRPYDPANLSWLTEWALNGHVPPNPQLAEGKKPVPPRTRAEVIREVARRKHGPRP